MHRSYAMLAGSHGLALMVDLAPEVLGTVSGDPLRVRQIISNFLNNALKFTAQGHIHLKAQRSAGADRVRVEVRDTGPGIDAATQARLFEPFMQADQSTTRRFGGTGLGLSICRQLATLMGGVVGVDSVLGQGASFWAELPLPPAPLAPSPIQSVLSTARPGDATLQGARVLMVEDNPVNMMIAVAMLERWGVQVTQAPDGREAVNAVQAAAAAGRAFDAVLMDLQMPEMSGFEATRRLRSMPQGHNLPIICLLYTSPSPRD